MLTSMRSRRMPALFTRTSRPPKVSTAWAIISRAASKSLTSAPLTAASPPMALISSTTCCAGLASAPVPSRSPPRSLTITLAPCSASISAYSRPIPRPAPVTIATRPSHIPAMTCLLRSDRVAVREHERRRGGEHPTNPVGHAHGDVGDLGGGAAAQLPHGLLDGEHAVHPGVGVREAPAVRVHRQRPAWRGVARGDERPRLPTAHEAEILEPVD